MRKLEKIRDFLLEIQVCDQILIDRRDGEGDREEKEGGRGRSRMKMDGWMAQDMMGLGCGDSGVF